MLGAAWLSRWFTFRPLWIRRSRLCLLSGLCFFETPDLSHYVVQRTNVANDAEAGQCTR